jgi:hypothetical protein
VLLIIKTVLSIIEERKDTINRNDQMQSTGRKIGMYQYEQISRWKGKNISGSYISRYVTYCVQKDIPDGADRWESFWTSAWPNSWMKVGISQANLPKDNLIHLQIARHSERTSSWVGWVVWVALIKSWVRLPVGVNSRLWLKKSPRLSHAKSQV